MRFHLNNGHTAAVKTKDGIDGAAVPQRQASPEYTGETRTSVEEQ
jgi:hypothetical protein